MRLICAALIIVSISGTAIAQELSDRARETNTVHDLKRQASALEKIQVKMAKVRAESRAARRVVADAEPASR